MPELPNHLFPFTGSTYADERAKFPKGYAAVCCKLTGEYRIPRLHEIVCVERGNTMVGIRWLSPESETSRPHLIAKLATAKQVTIDDPIPENIGGRTIVPVIYEEKTMYAYPTGEIRPPKKGEIFIVRRPPRSSARRQDEDLDSYFYGVVAFEDHQQPEMMACMYVPKARTEYREIEDGE